MIARKSISIVLVISLLMVFGFGKAVISEKEKPKSFPQTFPEGAPKEIIKEDGANMVLIPGGEFIMGTSNAEKQAGATNGKEHLPSAASLKTTTDFSIWLEMYGNGALTSSMQVTTATVLKIIPRGRAFQSRSGMMISQMLRHH